LFEPFVGPGFGRLAVVTAADILSFAAGLLLFCVFGFWLRAGRGPETWADVRAGFTTGVRAEI